MKSWGQQVIVALEILTLMCLCSPALTRCPDVCCCADNNEVKYNTLWISQAVVCNVGHDLP